MPLFKRRNNPDIYSLEYCVAIYQTHGILALKSHLDNQFTTEHLNKLCRELNLPLQMGTMNNIVVAIENYSRSQ